MHMRLSGALLRACAVLHCTRPEQWGSPSSPRLPSREIAIGCFLVAGVEGLSSGSPKMQSVLLHSMRWGSRQRGALGSRGDGSIAGGEEGILRVSQQPRRDAVVRVVDVQVARDAALKQSAERF